MQIRLIRWTIPSLAVLVQFHAAVGQTLSVNFRGTTLLENSASDQNGRPFTVTCAR